MPTRLVDPTTGESWSLYDDERSRQSGFWYFGVNRKSRSYVPLRYSWISKHHGAILYRKGRWVVRDGSSANTVTVNGEALEYGGDRAIVDGDVLGFGETRLRFETTGPPEPPDGRS